MYTILGIYVFEIGAQTRKIHGATNSFSTIHHTIIYMLIREYEHSLFLPRSCSISPSFPLLARASENVGAFFCSLLFIQQQIFRCSKWRDPTRSVRGKIFREKKWYESNNMNTLPKKNYFQTKRRKNYSAENGEWHAYTHKTPNENKSMVQLTLRINMIKIIKVRGGWHVTSHRIISRT